MTSNTDTRRKSLEMELQAVDKFLDESTAERSHDFKPPNGPLRAIETKLSHSVSDPGQLDSGYAAQNDQPSCSEAEMTQTRVIGKDAISEYKFDGSQISSSDETSGPVAAAETSPSPLSTDFEKESSPVPPPVQQRKLTFTKSIHVSGSPCSFPRATSTPYRRDVYQPRTPKKIVHSLRPLTTISAVRLNRAYELRFTENHEKKCLRDAREVSYQLYMSTARVLKRVPTIELGAGFP